MRMLEVLRDHLDDIEDAGDSKSFEFIEDLIIQMEQGRDFRERPLTAKQFKWVNDLYERYAWPGD